MKSGIKYTRIPGLHSDTLWIRTVYVRPESRGGGLARKMLTRFLAKHRASHLMLEAYPFDTGGPNAAQLRDFYYSLGFRPLVGSPLDLMYLGPRE